MSLLGNAVAKAYTAAGAVAAGIGGHYDNGVLKVYISALGIGNMAVVQNLQQHIEHIGVGLLYLVEEHHAIGLAADLLGELAGLIVANIAGRRTDDAAYGVLLHKLGHIQTHQTLGRVEEIIGKALYQLGLANAGAAHKDEGNGLALCGKSDAVALDGAANGIHSLVLTHDMLLQSAVKLTQAHELIGADGACGNLSPQLYNSCQIIGGEHGLAHGLQLYLLITELHIAAADLGQTLEMLAIGIGQQHFPLLIQICALLQHLAQTLKGLVLEINIGAGLVDKVYGLVGQEAVGDIALGELNSQSAHLGRDFNAVEVLVVMGNALQDPGGVLKGGLSHGNGLEAALQCGILLYMLAVFGKGGGADDLNFAAGEGGLQNIGGIHAALGIACAHDIMHLVDNEDNIALLADILNKALHAALELAAELGSRYQSGEIQKKNFLIPQLVGHLVLGYQLGQTLGDGGFANTGLAYEAGVILLAAVEYLDNALQLLIAAYHLIQLTLTGALAEVDAVGIQGLALFALLLAALGGRGHAAALAAGGIFAAAHQSAQEGEGGGFAIVIFAVGLILGDYGQAAHGLKGLAHTAGEIFQLLIGEAKVLDQILHGLYLQFTGAADAQTLGDILAVFQFG